MDEALINLDGMGNPGRDSTTLSVIDIDLSSLETMQAPTFHVIERHAWQGRRHLDTFGAITAIAEAHRPQYFVVDATGVGEGLWDMLDRKYQGRVIPVKFSQQTKSEIGYRFLSIVDTGRFRDHCHTDDIHAQYAACQSEILLGPAKTMRWGVRDGTRDASGELLHDDHLLADSLVTMLDALDWFIPSETKIIEQPDPLKDMDHAY